MISLPFLLGVDLHLGLIGVVASGSGSRGERTAPPYARRARTPPRSTAERVRQDERWHRPTAGGTTLYRAARSFFMMLVEGVFSEVSMPSRRAFSLKTPSSFLRASKDCCGRAVYSETTCPASSWSLRESATPRSRTLFLALLRAWMTSHWLSADRPTAWSAVG